MENTETSATRAYRRLTKLARLGTVRDADTFALAWLAAGRLVALNMFEGVLTVDELTDPRTAAGLKNAGFPVEAYDFISGGPSTRAQELSLRAEAAAIVSELTQELGQHRWDILPCLIDADNGHGGVRGTVIPELASLLMDMVGAPPDEEVWIPFDLNGQLTVEALRRGWRVLAASPLNSHPLVRQLVLVIETGQAQPPTVRTEVERDTAGRPVGKADYALVMTPFNVPVETTPMMTWDITRSSPHKSYARSDAWALFEFSNRIRKRGVFVTVQGILFSKGQEQRLREYLLKWAGSGNQIQTVVALPAGVFGGTGIGGAIVVLETARKSDGIHMADLDNGRRSVHDAGEFIRTNGSLALGETTPQKAQHVTYQEIWENELSFAPSRYLRQVADLGPNAAKLGDICEAIKAPATSKVTTSHEAAELGPQDLGKWQRLSHELDKTVFLKSPPQNSGLIQPDDIVLSIKGTVGKSALVGPLATHRATVVGQSCIALRLSPRRQHQRVTPEVLLMYLRSPHGQAQLAGLQVGTGVKHISPATLLSAMVVPVPTAQECAAIQDEYKQLCEYEATLASIEQEMHALTHHRWPDAAADG